jgi:methionyl-tRNA formyltransferase
MHGLDITILTDTPRSWFVPYAVRLKELLEPHHSITHVFNASKVTSGDILLILSCEKLISKKVLALNTNNIVVHPSALPQGKGWSPLSWQVLEGRNQIPITLFEAAEGVDSGDVYLRDVIELDGTELNERIKELQGKKVLSMVMNYINLRKTLVAEAQEGPESVYPRRTPKDSELSINKTLEENFNLLRTVDNELYPAFFVINGKKYTIKVYE